MTPDQIAEELNKVRRKRGDPDVDRDLLLREIEIAKKDILEKNLRGDDLKALEEFRVRELEREINETPFVVKFIWGIIFFSVIYLLIKLI